MLNNELKIKLVDTLGERVWNLPVWVLRNALGLMSVQEVAEELAVDVAELYYSIKKKYVPGPSVVVKRRKFYLPAEVEKLKNMDLVPVRWSASVVADMKKLSASGMSQKDIGRKYDTTQSTVSRLLRGRR